MNKKVTKISSPEKITNSSSVSEMIVRVCTPNNDRSGRMWTTVTTTSVRETKVAPKKSRLREKGDCNESRSSSHTQYFKQNRYAPEVYDKMTSDQYLGLSSSISGTSDSFHCDHPEGRVYGEKTLVKRYYLKEVDPVRMSEYGCHSLLAL